jgi:hypothetical protein
VTLKNHSTGEEKILFLSSEQEKDKTHFTDQVPYRNISLVGSSFNLRKVLEQKAFIITYICTVLLASRGGKS